MQGRNLNVNSVEADDGWDLVCIVVRVVASRRKGSGMNLINIQSKNYIFWDLDIQRPRLSSDSYTQFVQSLVIKDMNILRMEFVGIG